MAQIIFRKHYIQNAETGAKCKCWYSLDNRIDGRKCVTIYAKEHADSMNGIINFENHTDLMTDYFEKDRAVIFEGEPQYNEARAVAENKIIEQKQRHYNRLVGIYGEEKAKRYAGI